MRWYTWWIVPFFSTFSSFYHFDTCSFLTVHRIFFHDSSFFFVYCPLVFEVYYRTACCRESSEVLVMSSLLFTVDKETRTPTPRGGLLTRCAAINCFSSPWKLFSAHSETRLQLLDLKAFLPFSSLLVCTCFFPEVPTLANQLHLMPLIDFCSFELHYLRHFHSHLFTHHTEKHLYVSLNGNSTGNI